MICCNATFRTASPFYTGPMSSSRKKPARIALALAGGGPLGAIYEIGAL